MWKKELPTSEQHMLSVSVDETIHPATRAGAFQPIQMLQVELSQPLPHILARNEDTGQIYRYAIALVRLHTQPLGTVELRLGDNGLSATDYALQIWHNLRAEIVAHLRRDGLPPLSQLTAAGISKTGLPECLAKRSQVLASTPLVSVVIATRD